MVAEFLNQHEFEVTIESNGDAAARRIVVENPAAVLLDLNLPGTDGFEICRQVRSRYKGPILILTARGGEVDEIIGLDIGADDYLSKPVRPKILLARLRSHLRRSPDALDQSAPRQITVDDLTINAAQRTVEIDGQPLDLTSAEFDLLWFLALQAGKVVDRAEIYRKLLGFPYDGIDRSIDLRVSRLRKKLADDPTHPARVKSVRGVGYILVTRQ
ncbi:UNVERIFIED_CONTAM: hypothetical protein GTU68_052667 [Idotea baltica]|nr:hypothetical protein [Idotea baltica]